SKVQIVHPWGPLCLGYTTRQLYRTASGISLTERLTWFYAGSHARPSTQAATETATVHPPVCPADRLGGRRRPHRGRPVGQRLLHDAPGVRLRQGLPAGEDRGPGELSRQQQRRAIHLRLQGLRPLVALQAR